METTARLRIQFFLNGPFGNIETLSVGFIDDSGEVVETVVEGATSPQYMLWQRVLDAAASFERRRGHQLPLF